MLLVADSRMLYARRAKPKKYATKMSSTDQKGSGPAIWNMTANEVTIRKKLCLFDIYVST